MRLALTRIAATTVAVLALLAGCGAQTDSDSGSLGGSPAGSEGGSSRAGEGGAGGSASAGAPSSAGTDGGSSIAPTFATLKLVLQGGGPVMPCAAAPCHGVNGMAPPGDPLELPPNDDQRLYANLTHYVSKACGDLALVVPGNPAASALPKILTAPCGMTPRMPYMCSDRDGNCIPAEYVAAITEWIAQGAAR